MMGVHFSRCASMDQRSTVVLPVAELLRAASVPSISRETARYNVNSHFLLRLIGQPRRHYKRAHTARSNYDFKISETIQ